MCTYIGGVNLEGGGEQMIGGRALVVFILNRLLIKLNFEELIIWPHYDRV